MKTMFKALLAMAAMAFCVVQPAHADDSRMQIVSKVYDPASMATLTSTSTTVTVPGTVIGDACTVSSSISQALIFAECYVSANGTVTIALFNGTAGTIDLASSTWRVFVFPKGSR